MASIVSRPPPGTLPVCRQRDYASLNSHMTPKGREAPFATTSDGSVSDSPAHPLDPLDAAELEQAVRLLESEKHLGDNVRVVFINLIEAPNVRRVQ
jgi:Cu2+-containing amine oxidase